jgi:hypothetical protein
MSDPFDLTKLRLDPTDAKLVPAVSAGTTPKRLRKQRAGFTIFPNIWRERLANCGNGLTWNLALVLHYEFWRQGEHNPVKLPNGMLGVERVSRHAKYRALNHLERRKLVRVERRQGRSPLVTLVMDPA